MVSAYTLRVRYSAHHIRRPEPEIHDSYRQRRSVERSGMSLPFPVTRPRFVGLHRFYHFQIRAITVQKARKAIQ